MSKPKLLINLNILRPPLTGIGHYTLNIVRELLAREIDLMGIYQGAFLTRNDIQALISRLQTSVEDARVSQHKFRKKMITLIRAIPGAYWLKFFLQSQKIKNRLKMLANEGYVYFEPCFVPFAYPGKTITTIHDLSFIIHPEFHPKTRVDYLKNQMVKAIEYSDKLLVDSKSVLDELHQYYSQSKNKSSVLYLGVNQDFKPYHAAETQAILATLKLRYKSFLLSVATLEPRKNLLRLVEAYTQLPENIRNDFPLVLVGDSGWKNTGLFEKTAELFKKKQIRITGYLSDDTLKKIYSAAKLFVYPSLYEGFGSPIIEAMASGTAVITSNYGAMAEVAGESALLVDPYSIEDLKAAMLALLSNDGLCSKLSKKGMQRAAQFRWQETVEQLINEAMR